MVLFSLECNDFVARVFVERLLFDLAQSKQPPEQHFTMYCWGERGLIFPIKLPHIQYLFGLN